VPVIRRNNCFYATFSTFRSTLHTRQLTTQNNKYQVSQKHSCFSWWSAHTLPKHVEINKYTKNKYTKNKLSPIWPYLQEVENISHHHHHHQHHHHHHHKFKFCHIMAKLFVYFFCYIYTSARILQASLFPSTFVNN